MPNPEGIFELLCACVDISIELTRKGAPRPLIERINVAALAVSDAARTAIVTPAMLKSLDLAMRAALAWRPSAEVAK